MSCIDPDTDLNGEVGGTPVNPVPPGASFVVLGLHSELTDERVLTAVAGQTTITDNGAGSTVTVGLATAITSAISTNASDIAALTTTVGGHTSSISTLTSGLASAVAVNVTQTADIATNAAAIAPLTTMPALSVWGRDADTSGPAAPIEHPGTGGAMVLVADPLGLYPTQEVGVKFRPLIDMDLPFVGSSIGENGILRWYEYLDLEEMRTTVPFFTVDGPDNHALGSIGLRFLAPLTVDDSSSFNTYKIGLDILGVVPLTTKGDILGYDTIATRVPVGSNGKVLTADSTAAAGISWQTPTVAAPTAAKYLVQVADGSLPNAQAMGALATGIVKNTTTTGVQSIAVAGTDYESPLTFTGALSRSVNTVSLANTAVTPGSYTNTNLTVDAQGRITAASNGSASGADALGTYIVQTATNAPANAQVLASLATGMLSVTTTTGVVASTAFATNTIPLGSGSKLVDSTLTLASNVLTHAASSSAGAVTAVVSNTSNTASSTANLSVLVAGSSAGNPSISIGVTGGNTYSWNVDNATNDRFQLLKGATRVMEYDSTVTNEWFLSPDGTKRFNISSGGLSGDTTAGMAILPSALSAGNYINYGPGGTIGWGLALVAWNGTKYTNALRYVNPASGQPDLQLVPNGGTITSASTLTTFSAANSGANIGLFVENTSNTSSSTAKLRAGVGGTTAGAVGVYLERTGQNTWAVESTSAGTLSIVGGSQTALSISTTGESTIFAPFTAGGSARRTRITHTGAASGMPACALIDTPDAGTDLVIRGNATGTAGRGLFLYALDSVAGAWRKGLTVLNRAGALNVTAVDEGGNFVIGSMTPPTSLNLGLCISNGTAASAFPTGGGCFEVIAGALYWRGTSTLTLLAPA